MNFPPIPKRFGEKSKTWCICLAKKESILKGKNGYIMKESHALIMYFQIPVFIFLEKKNHNSKQIYIEK